MNEREAFIRSLAENLHDDTTRLVFADWLDDHGEHDRAEFIRVQCELEPMRDKYEIPRAAELHDREKRLERKLSDKYGEALCGCRRGFPDIISVTAREFIADAQTFRDKFPTLRRLVVHCFNGWGKDFATRRALHGLPELELACWYSDDDMKALAASPYLAELQVLVLWLSRSVARTTDAKLCQLAAKAKAWPK